MERPVAYEGSCKKVVFALRHDGGSPAAAFYDALSFSDQAKLLTLFERMGDHGRIANREKFKKIEDGLFEFKSFQIRMPCFFLAGGLVVITHGFRKKRDKIPRAEIDKARRIRDEDRNR